MYVLGRCFLPILEQNRSINILLLSADGGSLSCECIKYLQLHKDTCECPHSETAAHIYQNSPTELTLLVI